MIEAVNASLSTTQFVRSVAEEVSSSASLAANPARVQKAAIGTPYLSFQVKLAPKTKPIFVVRDTETGNAIKQFPTEAQIKAYQKAVQARAEAIAVSRASIDQSNVEIATPEAAKAIAESSVEFREERKVAIKAEVNIPGQSSGGSTEKAPAPAIKIGGTGSSFSADA